MNALFWGNWDSAGSSIAESLIREGNKVSWITEDEGLLWDKTLKGTVYRKNKSREEIIHILKAEAIDTVVFMTGALREDYLVRDHYESHLQELTEVLGIFRSHRLKTFVYLSSIETEFQQVLTPSINELTAGEEICRTYQRMYDIPVLILKFGCVYGNGTLENMGYIGEILTQLKDRKTVLCRYSKEDYMETICGNDLGIAARLLLEMRKLGTYRVMTGRPVNMQKFFECISEATGCKCQVEWSDERHTREEEYFSSDQLVKYETGWMPFYLLQEKGKEKIAHIFNEDRKIEKEEEKKKITLWHKIRGWKHRNTAFAIMETLLLFLVTCLLLRFQKDVTDLKYVDIRLLYVAIIAAVFGAKMGMLANVLAVVSYIGSLFMANVDPSYLLYSVDTWVPLVCYTLACVVVGYLTDRRVDDQEAADEKLRLLTDKYEFLKKIHGTTLEIKNYLQRQIVSSKMSYGRIYDVTVELDVLKPELILLKVINILETIMECDKAAVFLIDSEEHQFARLKACSTALRENVGRSLNMNKYGKLLEAFDNKRMYINTELLSDYPDYAAPFYYQGKLYGFIALYQIPTEKFTVYYQNAFQIVSNLIERYLLKALEYENNNKDTLYLPGTELLCQNAFEERLQLLRTSGEYASYAFIYGKVHPLSAMNRQKASECLLSLIRGSDCAGIDADGDYAVILINTTLDNLKTVKQRFEENGFRLEVEA